MILFGEYPINHYYAHRIDIILTWLADCAGLSPDLVTSLSLFVGLSAAFLISIEAWVGG